MNYYIDTHSHLSYLPEKGVGIEQFKNREELKIIDIGVDYDDFSKRYEILKDFNNVYFATAIYPQAAEKNIDELDSQLEFLKNTIKLNRDKIVAIGECGLDFFHNYGTEEKQIYLFEKQIELAKKNDLPILIHCRNADEKIVEILKKYAPLSGLIHCFSSNFEYAIKYISYGLCISFCGNLTYKNAKNLHQTAKQIDINKIVFETDAPYLSPLPLRGKINTPENVALTYKFFSDIRNIEIEVLKEIIIKNFKNIFKI